MLLLGDLEPGYPVGSQDGNSATITSLNYGSSGANDPQLWIMGFDEASIGEHASVTVDSDGLTGWTQGNLIISRGGNKFRTLDGRYIDMTNKAKIILFKAGTVRAPEKGTYHLTIKSGEIDTVFTITVTGV